MPRNPVQMINQYAFTDEIVLRSMSCQTEKIAIHDDGQLFQMQDAICQVNLQDRVDVDAIVAEKTKILKIGFDEKVVKIKDRVQDVIS